MKTTPPRKILFVCLGNICRSPMAEGIFADLVKKAGLSHQFEIDSAGTGDWHLGELADIRSRNVAQAHEIALTHRSRLMQSSDFDHFDLILAMDEQNVFNLNRLASSAEQRAKIRLLRDFDPQGRGEVPDPYYGGIEGFERMYQMLLRCSRQLLTELTATE
ncbi:MAG TPA: low molecular weight protein-tyrosine-phosphatase [Anaerolineales bacterium]|nr:low molecular weight protein-tyrosine-phosphatase [Anaerolineales bacterium]